MKKLILLGLITVNALAWEINTHRAIDRRAIENSSNLQTFVNKSGIKNTTYSSEKFEGYGNNTYFNYVTNGETNGISTKGWKQTFGNSKYQNLIEAGSILEDAQWPHASLTPDGLDRADGRFVNHFYDAQNGGKGLTYLKLQFQNALLWAMSGAGSNVNISVSLLSNKDNDYSYDLALEYFDLAFTSSDPAERKRYQAKMLVSLGHLMHMVNDMSVPAHVRADPHAEGDVMEVWARGGENGNKSTGFRVSGNTLKSYAGISRNPDNRVPKYENMTDFMTKEATWTATHFFSKDTIFTKKYPRESDTYEDLFYNLDGLEKYYVRSDSISGIPRGTKLSIRVKSYITNALKEKYYKDNKLTMGFDMSTSFQGNYSVIEDNARILIPRAIANGRNFVNYFFRGQISAKISNDEIVVTNISNKSLVDSESIASFRGMGGRYSFYYEDKAGIRKKIWFKLNIESDDWDETIAYSGPIDIPFQHLTNGFSIYGNGNAILRPYHSLKAPILFERDMLREIYDKKIIVVYDGLIGQERGIAVGDVQKTFNGTTVYSN